MVFGNGKLSGWAPHQNLLGRFSGLTLHPGARSWRTQNRSRLRSSTVPLQQRCCSEAVSKLAQPWDSTIDLRWLGPVRRGHQGIADDEGRRQTAGQLLQAMRDIDGVADYRERQAVLAAD